LTDLLIALLGFVIGVIIAVYFSRRKKPTVPKQRFRIEFWIFSRAAQRPSDADILKRISANSFAMGGITNEDARMIADIRFNIGRAMRSKNAMLFRPDVIGDPDAEIDRAALALVNEVDTLVTVRFAADSQPVEPKRYLRLATYAVEAICDLAKGVAVWDAVKQELFSPDTLIKRLGENADGAAFEHHVDIRWGETTDAGVSFTRGMEKIGLPDIEFDDQPLDQRTLATFLVEETAKKCWETGEVADTRFDGFGEEFAIEVGPGAEPSPRHVGPVVNLRAYRYRPVDGAG
jgi:hypothetical protein